MANRSAKARRVEARAFALADVGFEILGLVLIALGLLAALSLITYSQEDPAFRIGRPRQIYTGATRRSYLPMAERNGGNR